MVDWSKGAGLSGMDILSLTAYRQPSQNARVVAKQLQLLIEQLHSEVGLQYEDVHLIGHSLGAHIAGLASQHLSAQIGRITGKKTASKKKIKRQGM